MPITERQRQRRRNRVGSSDVATILGFPVLDRDGNPYKTRYDVWAEKRFETEPGKTSDAADLGNELEDALLGICAKRLGGLRYRRNAFRVGACGRIASHIDAVFLDLVDGLRCGMEAKTTARWEEWGLEDEDDTQGGAVPPYATIQAMTHCYTGELDRVYVVVLLPGYRSLEVRVFPIDRDDTLIDHIVTEVERFWVDHVETGVQPDDIGPTAVPILQRVIRVPEKVVPIDPEVVRDWEDAKGAAKAADAVLREMRAVVLDQLGDAEGGSMGALGDVTYFADKRGVRTLRAKWK